MGLIKNKLANLKETDIYSIILFALAKIRDIPEYSALSELAYILDKSSLIKLSQVFGGLSIKIPTLEEIEIISYALLLYEYIDVNNIKFEEALSMINSSAASTKDIKDTYFKIHDLLSSYELSSRGI